MKRLVVNSLILVGCAVFLLQLLCSVAGANATETTFLSRYNSEVFFPQGWGFFTRSPRQEKHLVYQVLPDGQLSPVQRKNGAFKNWFGLSRASRRINMETAQLVEVTKADSDWVKVTDHEATLAGVRFAAAQVDTIRCDPAKYHLLASGVYLLKRYQIPAWSWARYPGHFTPKALLKKVVLK